LQINTTGKSDLGLVRPTNEDSFYCDEKMGLLIVADGMGGQAAGEIASRLAVTVMRDYFNSLPKQYGRYNSAYGAATNRLNSAINLANLAILEAARTSPHLKGMGTTIVSFLLNGNRLSIAHIGDSRAYLIRAESIVQLTQDHSLVNEQVKKELITAHEASRSELKNILTKALGISEYMEAELDELTVFNDDILLLCTDGLSNMITDETMLDIILSSRNNDAACASLINAANSMGGQDNITAVIGHIKKSNWYSALMKLMEDFRR
jgi:serine/threonine protein phosphatase PrpC